LKGIENMKKHTLRLVSLALSLVLLLGCVQMSAQALFDFDKSFTVNITSEYFDIEDYDSEAIAVFDVTGYNGSYGAQLDDLSKEIYDDIVKNPGSMWIK
jgi:hypothetical protein